jgi:hypothetical protein
MYAMNIHPSIQPPANSPEYESGDIDLPQRP